MCVLHQCARALPWNFGFGAHHNPVLDVANHIQPNHPNIRGNCLSTRSHFKAVFTLLPSHCCVNCVVLLHCTHFPAGPSPEKGQRIQLSTYSMPANMFHRRVPTAGAVWVCRWFIRCKWSSRRRQRQISSQCDILLFVDLCTHSLLHCCCRGVPVASQREQHACCVWVLWDFSAFLQDSLAQRCTTALPGKSAVCFVVI